MRARKIRFAWLDVLILVVIALLIGLIVQRAQDHFYYRWNWQQIPGYFARYDAEEGRWILNLLGQGVLTTIRLALWGSVLAAVMGGVMGLCRVSHSLFLRLLSRTYVELVRNTPPLVFIFIFYFFLSSQLMQVLAIQQQGASADPTTASVWRWLFGAPELWPNFLSGLISLALFEGAYVTEIVRAGIESIPKGQWEAGRALGLDSRHVLAQVVLPQASRNMMPALAGQFISLIKDSSLMSLISIQEMTFVGTELAVSSGRVFEVWLTVAALYFVLCFSLSRLFRRLEQRPDKPITGRKRG